MSATSTPTLDVLSTIRDAAARIAKDARDNLAGIDVVSVSPLLVEQVLGGFQYSIVAIVPDRNGKDFTPSYVLLDISDDPFMAAVYRTALIVALEECRVQIFGDTLTLAKYCAKEWPSENAKQALDEFMRNRGLN
jgi:hypothetical protein